jgi:hypothetical protein
MRPVNEESSPECVRLCLCKLLGREFGLLPVVKEPPRPMMVLDVSQKVMVRRVIFISRKGKILTTSKVSLPFSGLERF